MEAALRRLQQHGCVVLRSGRHLRVLGPNGRSISASSTPSSQMAWKNMLRDARRHLGINL
jgi:hypothetical protein